MCCFVLRSGTGPCENFCFWCQLDWLRMLGTFAVEWEKVISHFASKCQDVLGQLVFLNFPQDSPCLSDSFLVQLTTLYLEEIMEIKEIKTKLKIANEAIFYTELQIGSPFALCGVQIEFKFICVALTTTNTHYK